MMKKIKKETRNENDELSCQRGQRSARLFIRVMPVPRPDRVWPEVSETTHSPVVMPRELADVKFILKLSKSFLLFRNKQF